MELGARVLRGPDWSNGNVDGGEGHLGTIVSLGGETTCEVLWDNGKRTTCRIGKGGKHDLRVFDSGSAGLQHTDISCGGCDVKNIAGTRWACITCDTFSLCTVCYGDMKHDIAHKFQRFDTPNSKGIEVLPRCSGVRIQATGLFPNASVRKGANWCEEETNDKEDGGNRKGKIISVEDHPSGSSVRSMVKVEWEDGQSGLYRAGHEGKVDVQYITEYPGTFYYRDHLNLMRRGFETATSVVTKPRSFIDGDRVCIRVSSSNLREMQMREGIWDNRLQELMPKFGRVKNYTNSGHVAVSYEGQVVVICEGALKKVPLLTEGDTVRISPDREEVEQLMESHGRFVDDMARVLGKVGIVKKVGKSGDVMVGFGGVAWQFNPACCIPAPGQSVDVLHDLPTRAAYSLQEVFEARDELEFNMENTTLNGERVTDTALLEKIEGMYDAFMKGNYSLCLMIMRLDPRLKKILHQGTTLLTLACNNRRVEFARQLLDEGVDINQPDAGNITPILHAMLRDNIDLAKLLVERGCNVNTPGQLQVTPLHMCAKLGKIDFARVLFGGPVNVNAQDMAENTPAHIAVESGHNDILTLILSSSRKPDPTITNGRGFTILHSAAIVGNYRAAEKIVKRFPDCVDVVMPEHKFTALHIATNNNHTDCVRVLVDTGKACVNAKNTNGWTPLHLACLKLHDSTVSCLLQKGANVNMRDHNGETPLHFVMGGPGSAIDTDVLGLLRPQRGEDEQRIKIACKLVQSGANADLTNNKGKSARDVAKSETVKTAVTMFIRSKSGPSSTATQSSSSSSSSQPGPSGESSSSTLTLPCSNCLLTMVDVKLRPCGHRFLCSKCVDVVKLCPFCKEPIEGVDALQDEGNLNSGQNCKVQ